MNTNIMFLNCKLRTRLDTAITNVVGSTIKSRRDDLLLQEHILCYLITVGHKGHNVLNVNVRCINDALALKILRGSGCRSRPWCSL